VVDRAGFEANVSQAIDEVVGRQKDIGLDLVNDGEAGKPSYVVYVKYRLTGFAGEEVRR
jgi:5-methyltetrahydropteroyltriglutamate--homocysteine methyltransferase